MAILLSKINEDLRTALKTSDEVSVSTLRFLLSHLHNAKIAKGADLTDEEIISEIAKDAKRHRESIEAFEKASRVDLASREKAELSVLTKYLGPSLTDEQIKALVDQAIVEVGAETLADMGKVIANVLSRARGQTDGATVAAIVREKLSNKNVK